MNKKTKALIAAYVAAMAGLQFMYGCPSWADSTVLNPREIREACIPMKFRDASVGTIAIKPQASEDAKKYAEHFCSMVSQLCSRDPSIAACQRHLKRYGLISGSVIAEAEGSYKNGSSRPAPP